MKKVQIRFIPHKLNCEYLPQKGSNVTYVFCHGFNADGYYYEWLINHLNKKGYSTFRFDLPNHGISMKWKRSELTLNNYAKLLAELIKRYQLKNIILVGHSMGGGIVAAALKYINNDLIKKIVLIDPLNRTIKTQWKTKIKFLFSRIFWITPGLLSIIYKNHKALKEYQEYKDFVKTTGHYFKNQIALDSLGLNILSKESLDLVDAGIKSFKKPINLIMGAEDKIFDSKKTAAWALELNKNVKYYEIPNSGHVPFLENYKAFIKILDTIK